MSADFFTHELSRDVGVWQQILAAVESALPTAPLALGAIGESEPLALNDPAAWCARHLTGHEAAYVTNGTEGELIRLSVAYIPPDDITGYHKLLDLSVEFPDIPNLIDGMPALMQAFGAAARVNWGRASTAEVGAALGAGRVGRTSDSPGPEYDREQPLSWLVIPGCLDWVSWWSEASCRQLGFSPEDPRVALFARVTFVPGHGAALQLTDEPLDLDRPEHLAAVTAAYRAFPEIDRKWGL